MTAAPTTEVSRLLSEDFDGVLDAWFATQKRDGVRRPDLFSDRESRRQLSELLRTFSEALGRIDISEPVDIDTEAWSELRMALSEITLVRTERGVAPWEMTAFMLALKQPVFEKLSEGLANTPERLLAEASDFGRVVDAFAMHINEHFIAERDEIIERQRAEMMELSTPVVQLWERVLTIPLIGTLDSMRAQEVMENLLNSIVEHSAEVVIVDITGVRVVDTQVAQHLLRTAAAVRLMGAEAIISGISPKIAQTMVELGVDVGEVTTRPSIRAALDEAFRRVGFRISRVEDTRV
ncbi:STAS domain-containing protein [Limimaricola hongkongensis]|uniref:RsbR, positive regulator of sigma-B n=1 Tax=Limimaricola hongkongensis DSM 17492 TaxID=1122180 RepID=A0A017HAF8_9RHOB|nr:STAS domain-containing protein [Limimaricola hongkongensis]EYD71108.1 RsbR, positive regulator of sigma-B [Limimaricola hongkongensis DSM 17492]